MCFIYSQRCNLQNCIYYRCHTEDINYNNLTMSVYLTYS